MTPEQLLAEHGLDDAAARLGAYVQLQRWFGGRARTVTGATVDDAGVIRQADPTVLFAVVALDYADGGRDRYQVPLGVLAGGVDVVNDPNRLVGEGQRDGAPVALIDGLSDPACALALWQLMAGGATVPTLHGSLRGEGDGLRPGEADAAEIHPLAREQSNTSVLRGEDELLKCFRRLEEGATPELEMTRALTQAGFTHVPAPLGAIEYRREGFEPALAAILQPFLRNGTEGWALALTSLRDLYADAEAEPSTDPEEVRRAVEEQGSTFLPEAGRLGETTAAMHLALAGEDLPQSLRPEPVSPAMLAGWATAMTAELDRLLAGQADQLARLRPHRDRVAAAYDAIRGITSAGLAIRHHGDYHLGQVLRVDAGWTILDFEGEPARPLAERRLRSTPLRDVAGMLRSLDYAAAAALAERARPGGDEWNQLIAYGDAWAQANRRLFWGAYLARCGDGPLLPPTSAQTLALRRAFELQKAVYEVGYELGHRPDWVEIPVRFIVAEVNR